MGNAASIRAEVRQEIDGILINNLEKLKISNAPLNVLSEALSPRSIGLPSPPHVPPVSRYQQGKGRKGNARFQKGKAKGVRASSSAFRKPVLVSEDEGFSVEIYAGPRVPKNQADSDSGNQDNPGIPQPFLDNEGDESEVESESSLLVDLGTIAQCITHPNTLAFLNFREIAGVVVFSKEYHHWLTKLDEGYEAMSHSLQRSDGIFVPPTFTGSWRKFFWEQAYPARKKWEAETEAKAGAAGGDFKIRVAVRFKPGGRDKNRCFLLPLHQRMKLLKKGEKLNALDEERLGLPMDAFEKLVESGSELSPEVLNAMLEAEALESMAKKAEADARASQHVCHKEMEFDEDYMPSAARAARQEEEDFSVQGFLPPQGESAVPQNADSSKIDPASEDVPASHHQEDIKKKKDGSRVLAVQKSRVVMYIPGVGVKPYPFSNVFNEDTEQREVYDGTAREIIMAALNGFNTCLLCYGQTGSGKTHTLFGPPGILDRVDPLQNHLPSSCGMVLRACKEILDAIQNRDNGVIWSATVQYVELYQGKVTDLCTGREVQLRDTGGGHFICQGALETNLENMSQVVNLLKQGESWKHFAETAMNDRSSRAHTIFLVNLCQTNQKCGTMIKSELHIVDLAGCEQIKKSKVIGMQRREAVGINTSLMVLGKCIRAILQQKSHIPYFESKLTLLLKGAFGGNSRTAVIITGSMSDDHGEETLNALKFGERCSMITNQTNFAATSVHSALEVIKQALSRCEHGIKNLEAKNKTHLPSYQRLKERYRQLVQKQKDIADKMEPNEYAKDS